MFRSARIKLTLWYLLIIMMVSIAFSAAIYSVLMREVERVARIQRFKIENGPFIIPGPLMFDPEIIDEARDRIILNIAVANGLILVVSGGLGYVLAGKTLQPIQEMVDEQNRFISDASHELRTPLTALKSSMEVYLRDKQPKLADAKELVSGSLEEVNQMQALSDSLLKLTQYQDPHKDLKLQRFPIKIACEDAAKKIEPLAKIKKIKLIQNYGEGELTGNKNAITELATILLDNAIKYSPEKSEVSISAQKSDGGIKMEVSDQGIGIKKEDIPHLFDRFYRADAARSKIEAPGYGLGLAIARKIVENHHGIINVSSEESKGSVFTVFFQNRKI